MEDEATPPTYRHDPSSDHEDDVSLMDTIDNLGRITRTSRRLPHSIRRSQPRQLHLNAISSPMTHHRAARAHGDPWQHPRGTHGQPSHYDVGAATTGTVGAVGDDGAPPPTYRRDPSTDHHPNQPPTFTLDTMEPVPPPSHECPAITDDTPSSSLATQSPWQHPRVTHGQPSHFDD